MADALVESGKREGGDGQQQGQASQGSAGGLLPSSAGQICVPSVRSALCRSEGAPARQNQRARLRQYMVRKAGLFLKSRSQNLLQLARHFMQQRFHGHGAV